MLLSILILIGSLAVLTGGAEILVRGSATLAKKMGVSSFFIGLTIVGFGTSTPELGTGITAAIKGVDDINVGNVIGSNIVNIAAIVGLGSLIAPTPVKVHLVRRETLVVIGLSFIPYLALLTGGYIPRSAGVVLVLALVVYLTRSYFTSRQEAMTEAGQAGRELEVELEHELGLDQPGWRSSTAANIAFVAIGLVMLGTGAHYLVQSSVQIAQALGVSELIIALTVIAGGTSAPELLTTVIAAIRRQSDIAIGNILGSNIFNLLGILGFTCIVAPQRVGPQVLWIDAPLMILLSMALLPIMTTRALISRVEGSVLLAIYLVYLVALFTWVPTLFPAAATG